MLDNATKIEKLAKRPTIGKYEVVFFVVFGFIICTIQLLDIISSKALLLYDST